MKRNDALWLLALPIYLIIGAARHELSHAAVAMLQGAVITEIQLLPSIHPQVGFLWGYVGLTGGHTTWIMQAAPYVCDLLFFAVFIWLCIRVHRMPRWLWLNCFVLGIASPLLNTVYNYQKVITRPYGDVNDLMTQFPPALVHVIFFTLIVLFCVGTWAAIRAAQSRYLRTQGAPTIASDAAGIIP